MQINNCLVIIKQTAMAQGGRAASFARKGDETAKRLLHADAEQKRTVDAVRRALKSRKIAFEESSLVKLNAALKRQLAAADFVISIGGDGTALGASHYLREAILQMAVPFNSLEEQSRYAMLPGRRWENDGVRNQVRR